MKKPLLTEYDKATPGVATVLEYFEARSQKLRSVIELPTTTNENRRDAVMRLAEIKKFFKQLEPDTTESVEMRDSITDGGL